MWHCVMGAQQNRVVWSMVPVFDEWDLMHPVLAASTHVLLIYKYGQRSLKDEVGEQEQ